MPAIHATPHVNGKYGAPMGRYSDPLDSTFDGTVKIARLPFVDYDYDQGGAYWGGNGDAMWSARWEDAEEVHYHYFRAQSYRVACKYVLAGMPDVTCIRAVNVVKSRHILTRVSRRTDLIQLD
jgi:hypothetical protein